VLADAVREKTTIYIYIYIYNVTRDLVNMGSVLKWIDNVIPAQGDGHTPQGMV
jgi:hypothetical protein